MKKVWITLLVALIGAAGVIIAAFISKTQPPPPGPTPTVSVSQVASIPALHGTYAGTMLRYDGRSFNLAITSLNEDQNGNFTAQGALGGCTATFSGRVYSDGAVSFYGQETQQTGCSGDTSTFNGEVYPDGHLSGNWNTENTIFHGTWSAS